MGKIAIQGMTRTSRERTSSPGSCNEIINMRENLGAWELIGNKEVLDTIQDATFERILTVHPVQEGTNIIYLTSTGIASKTVGGGSQNLLTTTETATCAEWVNNVLCVMLDSHIEYFIWKETGYIRIDIATPLSVTMNGMPLGEAQPNYAIAPGEISALDSSIANLQRPSVWPIGTDVDAEPYDFLSQTFQDRTEGHILEVIQNAHKLGVPVGPVVICFTLEMFDGTEIFHTALTPVTFADTYIYQLANNKIKFGIAKYHNPGSKLTFGISPSSPAYQELFNRVNIYITRPLPPVKRPSALSSGIRSTRFDSVVEATLRNAYLSGTDLRPIYRPNYDLSEFAPNRNADGTLNIDARFNDRLLYRVGSVPYADIIASSTQSVQLEDIADDKIATYPPLPVDNFSHHQITAKDAINYNGRLVLANTITTPGIITNIKNSGNVSSFYKREIVVTDIAIPTNTKVGSLVISRWPNTNSPFMIRGYWNGTTTQNTPPNHSTVSYNVVTEVKIITDQGEREIISHQHVIPGTLNTPVEGWLSYPDARASQINVYIKPSNALSSPGSKYSIPLKKSTLHNVATGYLNTNEGATPFVEFPIPKTIQILDANRVQASSLNNPFTFPAINSYRVGLLDIIKIQTIANALSEGQFGDFPVIAFSKSGIWAMRLSQGDGFITSVVPLANHVCINKDSITAINDGIVFATVDGLNILQRNNVTEISHAVEGSEFSPVKIRPHDDVLRTEGIFPNLSQMQFNQYIQTAKVGYDNYYNEIIVSSPNALYSYIYSVRNKTWTKSTVAFQGFYNKFPHLLGFKGRDIMSLNKEVRVQKLMLIIFNPWNFDNTFTKITEIVARGNFSNTKVILYGTTDAENWRMVSIATCKKGTDILLPRVPYTCKSYICVIVGTLTSTDYIHGLEMEITHRYTSKKRPGGR